jgi:hypothetical protein
MKSQRNELLKKLFHFAMGASLGAILLASVFSRDFASILRMINSALFITATANVSSTCPELAGSYKCLAVGNQAPMKLIISNSHYPNGSTIYKFRYVRSRESTWVRVASREGIKMKDGSHNSCTDQEFIINETKNFLNSAGDYQATINGKTQMICARQK